MNIPPDWTNILIGAALGLGFAWFKGWLVIPGWSSPASEKPKTVVYQALPAPSTSPTYEATVEIPHKITVTPQ